MEEHEIQKFIKTLNATSLVVCEGHKEVVGDETTYEVLLYYELIERLRQVELPQAKNKRSMKEYTKFILEQVAEEDYTEDDIDNLMRSYGLKYNQEVVLE